MANDRKHLQKKVRILTKARDLYCCDGGAGRRAVVNCTVPQMSRQIPTKYSPKEIDSEDLQGLMRILSMKKGGGARVDVDSEGNLVWRKHAEMDKTYGDGVGKIGRIDEEKTCSFSEVDVRYSRSVSDVIGVDKKRVLAYYSKN